MSNNNYYKKNKYYSNNQKYNHNNHKYYYKKKKNYNDSINNENNVIEEIELVKKHKYTYDELINSDNKEEVDMDNNEEIPVKKSFVKKTVLGYILGAFILVIALLGASYSFFNYYKEDSREADIVAGEAYVRVLEDNLNLSITKAYPREVEEARSRTDNYIDFNLVGKNTSETRVLQYKFTLSNGNSINNKTRINPEYILFDLSELDANDDETLLLSGVSLSAFNNANIGGFYIPTNQASELQRKYRIRAWISEDVLISDTDPNRTYTQSEFNNLFASFTVNVNSYDRVMNLGSKAVLATINNKIDNNVCSPIWTDTMDTADTSDDITYLSGTNTCVDFNYVWYSGRLWRITAIYPDGSMKLITQDALTTIKWGNTVEYNGSMVYQWINEDFYDTLIKPEDFLIENSTWNYSTDASSTPVRPESIVTQKTVTASVGLLNAYEYYNAYRNASDSTNYLNISYFWWLLTPYSEWNVRYVASSGSMANFSSKDYMLSVRPSIILKSGVEFNGSGTKTNPYKIVGDKDSPSSGALINSRSVGEYVKFDNDIYRIVSIDETNKTTRLTRVDYLRDGGEFLKKKFGSTAYFGKDTNTKTDTYWDYYLNNTWYESISSTYRNMLVDGTYYLGEYVGTNGNILHYKMTICKDELSTLDTVTTKNCNKYTSDDTNRTFTGKVGLPRLGEMFASQIGSGSTSSAAMWSITPQIASVITFVSGNTGSGNISTITLTVRPSITLSSSVIITGGTGYIGGDTNSPFEISMPNNS